MCGFVFAYARNGADLPDAAALDRMDTALRHRGPDAHGQQRLDRAVMGHRRLAIIDLDGGQQPLCSPDVRVWVVFNGEIYNFRAVQAELASCGQPLESSSDTEVLLHAYLAWGDRCVDHLNGMFAFAIYDGRTQSVFAARDRFGEKPLYVLERAGVLYLASELKALVVGGVVERSIDPVALYHYFTSSYVIGPRTIYRSVRRLQPGHWIKADGSTVVEHCYWRAPRPTGELTQEHEVVERALELLRDSIRLRLISDVPIGFFLSGGVDSSAVVALASELAGQKIETFSIGFSHPRFDERSHARFVAERFGTNHHEFVLESGGLDVIEQIAWHADEPFADSSALPTWHLAKITRRHVSVALSGDGGDEMFAGYDSYRGHMASELVRRVPRFMRVAGISLLRSMPVSNPFRRFAMLRLARNIEDAELAPAERLIAKQQVVFRREFLAAICRLPLDQQGADADRETFAPMFDRTLNPLSGMTLCQQTVSLPDDMLVKVDRMSMAHGLEVRAPFLDHRLAELMNSVAPATKLPRGQQKYILRKALVKYFPREFLWRPKQGFNVPLSYWFKDGLNDYIRQRLLRRDALVGKLFHRDALQRIIGEHTSLTRDWSFALWALLMFETWCERFDIRADHVIP